MKDKKVNGIHCKRNTSFTLTYIFSTSPFHVMCNTELFSVKKYSTYYYWCQSMSNNDLDQEYELYDEKLIVRLQDKQLYSLVMSFMCILLTTKNYLCFRYDLLIPPTPTYFFLFLGPRQFRNLPNIPFHFSCWDISNLDVIRTILSEWCLMDHHSEIHTHHTQLFSIKIHSC